MKERPILFSGSMVRAILAGTKTQTRRLIKPLVDCDRLNADQWPAHSPFVGLDGIWRWMNGKVSWADNDRRGPYGVPGDRLWVRETWRALKSWDDCRPASIDHGDPIHFEADVTEAPGFGRLRPGMFMPRWASRITLEVTGVRIERLQEISEQDAIAEGMLAVTGDGLGRGAGCKWNGVGYEGATPGLFHAPDRDSGRCCCKVAGPSPAQCAYRDLWDHINAKRAPWASNPWVWVPSFKRIPNG